MKRTATRFAIPFTVLLLIPFVYNSCQGGLMGTKGFSSIKSSCKMEKGVVVKLQSNDGPPLPFRAGKVRLSDSESNSGLGKASSGTLVRAGEELAVLVNNQCLHDDQMKSESHIISRLASESQQIFPGLDEQAYAIQFERDYSESEIEQIAESDPCVIGVSWNHEYKVQALPAMSFNDSAQMYQGHIDSIRAKEAFSYFYSSTGMQTTGAPVVVAVVDTGADLQHPDLRTNLWTHTQGIGVDITALGTASAYTPTDVSDIGHGTHVTGLIGAVSNNGTGIIGHMPYRVKVMPIKIFSVNNQGELSTSSQHFANAIKFAYLNSANVINLSLGSISSGPASDPVAESAINEALQAGATVVTVIGNADSGQTGKEINGTTLSAIPAQFSIKNGMMAVGSFDSSTGNKSSFSHYSTTYAEISAPGAEQGFNGLYSTIPTRLSSYGTLAGTSQAAPLVSAAAALTYGIIKEVTGFAPTPTEVERLILSSAIKSPALTNYFKNGNRLDYLTLISKIQQDYPTAGGGAVSVPSSVGCVP